MMYLLPSLAHKIPVLRFSLILSAPSFGCRGISGEFQAQEDAGAIDGKSLEFESLNDSVSFHSPDPKQFVLDCDMNKKLLCLAIEIGFLYSLIQGLG